jgi:hypothetical protein
MTGSMFGFNARLKANAANPAMQEGQRADQKLSAISEHFTGLPEAAYATYAEKRIVKVKLKLTATPVIPHLIPIKNPATHTGADTSA